MLNDENMCSLICGNIRHIANATPHHAVWEDSMIINKCARVIISDMTNKATETNLEPRGAVPGRLVASVRQRRG